MCSFTVGPLTNFSCSSVAGRRKPVLSRLGDVAPELMFSVGPGEPSSQKLGSFLSMCCTEKTSCLDFLDPGGCGCLWH